MGLIYTKTLENGTPTRITKQDIDDLIQRDGLLQPTQPMQKNSYAAPGQEVPMRRRHNIALP